MRTAGMVQAGTPNPDGHIFIGAKNFNALSGAMTLTRGAKGNIYGAIAAGATVILDADLSYLLFRYGVQDDIQMQWGSTANGGSQGLPTPPAVYVNTAPNLNRPPYTGSSQLVPNTSRPTGIAIKTITPIFTIAGVAATLNQVGISKTQFAAGVAPVITDVLAPITIGTAVNANQAPPITVNANAGQPSSFLTPRLADYILEWQITTPAGSTAQLFGAFLDVVYNYN